MRMVLAILLSALIWQGASRAADTVSSPPSEAPSDLVADAGFAELDLSVFENNPELARSLQTLKTAKGEGTRAQAFFAIIQATHKTRFDRKEKWTDQQQLAVFLAGLRDTNVVIQMLAARQLSGDGQVGNLPPSFVRQGALASLVEVLKDRSHEGRSLSYRILDDVTYGANSESLRAAIVETLGKIGDEKAVDPLLDCLKDEKLALRSITALGELAKLEAPRLILRGKSFAQLARFLETADRNTLVETALTLHQIDAKQAFAILDDMLRKGQETQRANAAVALGFFADGSGEKALMEAVTREQSSVVRAKALWSLCHSDLRKDPSFVTAVLPFLKDSSPDVRAATAYSLGGLKDERIIKGIVPLLSDPEPKVRAAAVVTAGRCGDRTHFEQIVKLLDDGDPQVRYDTLTALAALGDARAVAPIKARMGTYAEITANGKHAIEFIERGK